MRSEYMKSYYEAHKEYFIEKSRKQRLEHKEKVQEYMREYYKKNKEKITAYKKKYREEHHDYVIEHNRQYRRENAAKIKESNQKYYSSPALYESFNDRFFQNDEIRQDDELLLVRCRYCGTWFNPSTAEVLRYISDNHGGNYLYCSDACKKSCPSYKMKKHPRGFRQNTSREVLPELRKMVLERDNWTCQKCGKNKYADNELALHVHHIVPVKIDPIQSADIDNCVTLCKECHKKIHSEKDCRYTDIANCREK